MLGIVALHSLGSRSRCWPAARSSELSRDPWPRSTAPIAERRERIRLELYTVNQLLAMHVRTGAGPIQATQRIVDRGHGVLVEELDGVLACGAQRHRPRPRRSVAPPT